MASNVLVIHANGAYSYMPRLRAESVVARNCGYWKDPRRKVLIMCRNESRVEQKKPGGFCNRLPTKTPFPTRSTPIYDSQLETWRESVLLRDGYRCVWCGSGSELQADHIREKAIFPNLKYSVSNGRTLCKKCHRYRHSRHFTESYAAQE